jgi:transposase
MPDALPPLPTTLAECHALLEKQRSLIASQQATIEQQQATIDEQQSLLQSLQRDIALLKRSLFGQRRERFDDPDQGLLFDFAEIGKPDPSDDSRGEDSHADLDGCSDVDDTPSSERRKGRKRRVIPESLPRTQRVHKLDESEIPEELEGTDARRFLKKVGEYVEWEPSRLTVVEEFVETLAIDNADATETKMVSARRAPRILNCFAGPSLLAGLTVQHFADHLPYYRLEEILTRSRLEIDRSTQCRWMIRLAERLTPLTDWMRSLVLRCPVVLADETPVQMLVPGLGKTKTTYLWAVLGGEEYPYTTFSFGRNRCPATRPVGIQVVVVDSVLDRGVEFRSGSGGCEMPAIGH